MKCLIIGLGIYGSNLAKDLTDAGHEVIGADMRPTLVEAVKDYISTVYIVDSTDESALNALPIFGVDLVIVAIGENFGASVKTVALLKKLGVKHIYARAVDDIHQSILEGLKVDRILNPEQRAAFDLTQEMSLGDSAQVLRITRTDYVMKFTVPSYFAGMKYADLELKKGFGITLVAATRRNSSKNLFGVDSQTECRLDLESDPELRVTEGDELTCLASAAAYRKLIHHVK